MRSRLLFPLILACLAALSVTGRAQSSWQGGAGWQIDRPDEYQVSTEIVDLMDSLLMTIQARYIAPSSDSLKAMNKYNFELNFVPSYDAETYALRLRDMCTVFRMDYNPQVRTFINLYATRNRRLTERLLGRQHIFFPMIEEIFIREGVPVELKYLAVIESALNPNAVSRAGATGLWQFMYGTGLMYGLRIDSHIDERRDPYKSTVAAAAYLKDLYKVYNDWQLVIAAYNCGPGRVNRCIRNSGGCTDFWKLSRALPRETASYVPAFIGATYAMTYPAEHNLFPMWTDFSYNQDSIVIVNQEVSLEKLAQATGTDVDVLKELNPELRKGVVPFSTKPYKLRAPRGAAEHVRNYGWAFDKLIAAKATDAPDSLRRAVLKEPRDIMTWDKKRLTHKVEPGQSLAEIAAYYKTPENALAYWNDLWAHYVPAGKEIAVYVDTAFDPLHEAKLAQAKEAEVQAVAAKKQAVATAGNPRYHRVRNGDTLWAIANRYQGVSIDKLLALNGLHRNSILRPGQLIRLPG